MMHTGGDELFCDLAETYGILDPRALGARRLAVLASGLPEDARVRRKEGGSAAGTDTLLLASMADTLNLLSWRLCCAPGAPRPESILAHLLGGTETAAPGVCGFERAEDFEAAREGILREAGRHGDGAG